jgi:hypothetical protein
MGGNDRGWKSKFFFVRLASLGPEVDYLFGAWRGTKGNFVVSRFVL